jgi:hypothetical protein
MNPALLVKSPRSVGISAIFCFRSKADCVAVDTGLLASEVLSTFHKPILDFVMLTLPVL